MMQFPAIVRDKLGSSLQVVVVVFSNASHDFENVSIKTLAQQKRENETNAIIVTIHIELGVLY